uniref:NAD-dependent epimerase/dehydratase domain-containing protein n=1 Tax=Arcella intermedia TaxID=1963864 RepID=A0A6B2L9L8_9EUKA
MLAKKKYVVRGTVRSKTSEAATKLAAMFPELQLFEADLCIEGSFKDALNGADVVIHTASPFPMNVTDPQKELIDPALNGTRNVLNTVSQFPQITHVVVTSSCAAVVEHHPTDDGTKVWGEDDWNTTSSLTEGPYRLSKVLAEKFAFEWAEKHPKVSLATMLPSFVIGPPRLDRVDATSIKLVRSLLDGSLVEAGVPAASFGVVDIREVAQAHIEAFERSATGRFVLSTEKGIPRIEMCNFLKKEYPHLPVPNTQVGTVTYKGGSLLPTGSYTNQRAQSLLGITFRDWQTSLRDMAQQLFKLGIVKNQ